MQMNKINRCWRVVAILLLFCSLSLKVYAQGTAGGMPEPENYARGWDQDPGVFPSPPLAPETVVIVKPDENCCGVSLISSPTRQLPEQSVKAPSTQNEGAASRLRVQARQREEAALVAAVRANDEEQVRQWLERGVDPNARNDADVTALHEAAQAGFASVATLLLAYGADPDPRDGRNRTPLHAAAQGGSKAIAELLLERGASPYARDADNLLPLHAAARAGRTAVVQSLLATGIAIDIGDEDQKNRLALGGWVWPHGSDSAASGQGVKS